MNELITAIKEMHAAYDALYEAQKKTEQLAREFLDAQYPDHVFAPGDYVQSNTQRKTGKNAWVSKRTLAPDSFDKQYGVPDYVSYFFDYPDRDTVPVFSVNGRPEKALQQLRQELISYLENNPDLGLKVGYFTRNRNISSKQFFLPFQLTAI